MNVYYQIRSSQLDRSIKGLREHFRKNSSASGVPYSPAIPNKRKETPTKKPIKRPGESPPRPCKHQPEGGGTCVALGHPGVSGVGPSSCRRTGQKASVCPQPGPPGGLFLLLSRAWGLHPCLWRREGRQRCGEAGEWGAARAEPLAGPLLLP